MGHLENPVGFIIVVLLFGGVFGRLALDIILMPFRMMNRAKERRLAEEKRIIQAVRYDAPTIFDFDGD